MAGLVLDNIKAIIFDLDGTLIDAYRPIESSFNFTMRKLGQPKRNKSEIRRAVGWGDEMLLAPFLPREMLTSGLRIYRAHHKKALPQEAKLFPKVKQLLERLSFKYFLAVASNRPTKFSQILLTSFKLSKYFDFFLCADSLKKGKPHPEILIKAIRHFRIRPAQAVYVGDMAIDAQTAKRARIKSIIVTTGSSSLREIKKEKPYRIISEIRQLKGLFKI